jgi:hypothetical protein
MFNAVIDGCSIKEYQSPGKHKLTGYLVAIAVNIFLLYVVNNLVSTIPHTLDEYASKDYPGIIITVVHWAVNFQASFITSDFVSCLWAINLALCLGIIGNFTLLLYRPDWLHHLIQIILSATGFLAVFVLFNIFPFSIVAGTPQTVIRVLLIMAMAGMAVSLIVELIRFIRSPVSFGNTRPQGNDSPDQT